MSEDIIWRRVVVETPYAGKTGEEVAANVAFARACMLDALNRDEAPFLSHLLYTQVLDDSDRTERKRGIGAGLAWGVVAEASIVYTNRGITKGMRQGIERAHDEKRPVEFRWLEGFEE